MPTTASRNEKTYFESLSLIAANELALESLYREYARQHVDHAPFWLNLATAEHGHAHLVTQLAAKLRSDAVPQGRFKIEAIRTFTEYLTQQQAAAQRGEVPYDKAVVIASYIEDALLERRFFEQLPADDSELKKTLSALARATEGHAAMLKEARAQLAKQ